MQLPFGDTGTQPPRKMNPTSENKSLVLRNFSGVEIVVPAEWDLLKAEALATAAEVQEVKTDLDNIFATQARLDLNKVMSSLENDRLTLKRLLIDLGRKVDTKAQERTEDLRAEDNRIGRLQTAYNQELERKKQEADRKRREEEARLERERLRRLQEIEDARIAEEARLQAEKNRLEKERIRAEEEALAKVAQGAQVQVAMQEVALAAAKQTVGQKELERKAEALALEAQQAGQAVEMEIVAKREALPTLVNARPKGSVIRTRWVAQVVFNEKQTERRSLELLYAAHPELVELSLRKAAVNIEIAGGIRELPGLEIFEETTTGIRLPKKA